MFEKIKKINKSLVWLTLLNNLLRKLKSKGFYLIGFCVLFSVSLVLFANFYYAQAQIPPSEVVQISAEVLPPPPPPPPHRVAPLPIIETKVVLEGRAYPLSLVTILQNGEAVAIITADAQANFRAEITDITPGIWTFGIWAEDKEGRRSIVFSFTTRIRAEMITTISGIFLPPTIGLERTRLQRGEILNVLGMTVPQGDVSVFINSPEPIIRKTQAGDDGIWFYGFDTAPLKPSFHTTQAKAVCPDGLLSTFSHSLAFNIGEVVIEHICPGADLNKDGRVNLIDFSILLFWWGTDDACSDQNMDGIVNLPDFSIMMYYWTG